MRTRLALRYRIVIILLAVSLLPLALVGFGAWWHVGRLLQDKTLELHRNVVQSHARTIEMFLDEHIRLLELVARSHTLEELTGSDTLQQLLDTIQASHGKAFVDLGVIGEQGNHLAYVGPYRLEDKNYAGERWFEHVMRETSYVSDVFPGFRKVPHCILAVKRQQPERAWILRATINSERFDRLVQTGRLGQTGDAFLVDRQGRYLTPPREGRVLEPSPLADPQIHSGVRQWQVDEDGRSMLRVTTWLNDDRWLLVVQQEANEIQAPVRRAMLMGALVLMVAVALVVLTTVLATWHLTARIDRATAERDGLSRDLLRSAKLASLGELATGLAHEINNPLAIISAEQTNISDMTRDLPAQTPGRDDILQAVDRCKHQVARCGAITAKMLQFGRDTPTRLEPIRIGDQLAEVVALMHKQAVVRNIALRLEMDPDLPQLLVDKSELEQVVVNLINNSLQALDGGGQIQITARQREGQVFLEVSDNGSGIPSGLVDKVFQPFFTTKAPGEGTGLGLAVCYGIVTGWGGTIEATSEEGRGTVMTIRLPIAPADEPGRASGGRAHGDD